jgi:hypothetical protein
MQIINGNPEEIAAYELALKDGKCADWQLHREEILQQVQKVIADELA